ncbi:hypothetical protein NW762_001237 [Fusarium torreyae]|uniref:Uncharacterized protein n=1 Tax=Fusarium torreyae TaxID=1237075 RepID=A0A9W8VN95_9HYPO|nr:hypothetical protein NW762_001237 [Fusarium torreyae]
MPPEPPPPLPVASNHAALSNRISMLLASQSGVLKTMNLSRPAPTKRRTLPDDNDDDLTRGGGARPNEGVGYVPEKKDVQKFGNAKEERMLRGRIGKNGVGKTKARVEESESEEEAGRSALGKRKRPRREREVEVGHEDQVETKAAPMGITEAEQEDEAGGEIEKDVDMKDSVTKDEGVSLGDATIDKKRKKKNKKKKKQKTTNA